jgi:hypothetical protein
MLTIPILIREASLERCHYQHYLLDVHIHDAKEWKIPAIDAIANIGFCEWVIVL